MDGAQRGLRIGEDGVADAATQASVTRILMQRCLCMRDVRKVRHHGDTKGSHDAAVSTSSQLSNTKQSSVESDTDGEHTVIQVSTAAIDTPTTGGGG
jgi:hypothetical protein